MHRIHRLVCALSPLVLSIVIGLGACQNSKSQKAALDSSLFSVQMEAKAPSGSKWSKESVADLVTLLAAGKVDYFFALRSQAQRANLDFFVLPTEVNLGDEDYTPFYGKANLRAPDGTPRRGGPIQYGVTVPEASANLGAAHGFLTWTFGPQGKTVLENVHVALMQPVHPSNLEDIPPDLRGLCQDPGQENTAVVPPPAALPSGILRIATDSTLEPVIKDLKKEFEKSTPNLDIRLSVLAPEKLAEAAEAKQMDLVFSSDARMLKSLLLPDYTPWMMTFGKDQLVLAKGKNARHGQELSEASWSKILLMPDVQFARLHPEKTSVGFYTEASWKLTDIFLRLDERGLARLHAKAERFQEQKRGVMMKVRLNDKVVAELSRKDFSGMTNSSFQVKENPIKAGISFADFFKKQGIRISAKDDVAVMGNKKANFSYGKILEDDMGLVLTRKGTPKVVARKGQEKYRLAHIHTITVTTKN